MVTSGQFHITQVVAVAAITEPKTVKNRGHIDLAFKHSETERLIGLGATRVEYVECNGGNWAVMLDPEGNEFCVG